MKLALCAHSKKPHAVEVATTVRDFLQAKGATLVAQEELAPLLALPPLSPHAPIDVMISIGGDGTILRLLHSYPDLGAPILGINVGQLGFMADVPLSDLHASLEDLLSGAYAIQQRIVIEGITPEGELVFAVNEMVVHRAKNPSLIDLAIYVDGTYLNTFSADGIIIATPCGSTAYSLAAGGPILAPDLQALVITPICPHTISNRPLVLMPKKEITIHYLSPYAPVEITYDGFSAHTMATGSCFTLRRSERLFPVVKLTRTDDYATLRTKLNWSGHIRPQQFSLQK